MSTMVRSYPISTILLFNTQYQPLNCVVPTINHCAIQYPIINHCTLNTKIPTIVLFNIQYQLLSTPNTNHCIVAG